MRKKGRIGGRVGLPNPCRQFSSYEEEQDALRVEERGLDGSQQTRTRHSGSH